MMMDRDTKAFRGFCYVVFETPEDLTAALSLDGVVRPFSGILDCPKLIPLVLV